MVNIKDTSDEKERRNKLLVSSSFWDNLNNLGTILENLSNYPQYQNAASAVKRLKEKLDLNIKLFLATTTDQATFYEDCKVAIKDCNYQIGLTGVVGFALPTDLTHSLEKINEDKPPISPEREKILKDSGFNKAYQPICEKSRNLQKRGHVVTARALSELFIKLQKEKMLFLRNQMTKEVFTKNCENHIAHYTKEGHFEEHRGFFGTIAHALRQALNNISKGKFEIKPTDTMVKVTAMKDSLKSINEKADEPKNILAP